MFHKHIQLQKKGIKWKWVFIVTLVLLFTESSQKDNGAIRKLKFPLSNTNIMWTLDSWRHIQ